MIVRKCLVAQQWRICQQCRRLAGDAGLTLWLGKSPAVGNGMERAMAPHSSTLALKIPWLEEPDGLQSMGSLGVRHDWATSLLLFTFMHWRRKWQPTPVFFPGKSQGWSSLVGCRLWGRTELGTTEATWQQQQQQQEMATHSSILAWKSPWTEELDWLQSMQS